MVWTMAFVEFRYIPTNIKDLRFSDLDRDNVQFNVAMIMPMIQYTNGSCWILFSGGTFVK